MARSMLLLAAVVAVPAQLTAGEKADYLRDVKPVLKARCFACHGSLKQKAKLRLDAVALIRKGGRHGSAVEPGDADNSLLIERITEEREAARMPPQGKPLSDKEIALLKAWIDEGAPAPADEKPEEDPRRHWAFQNPIRPSLPTAPGHAGSRNPVDAFLDAERTQRGVQASPPADRATLLRRVYLDLIGLPPTREQLRTFLEDESYKIDPENLLIWHFSTRRMEAEEVRDSVLFVAGELDATLSGPETPHEQGMTSRRRSLYFAHHGEGKMEFLELFDAAKACEAYRRSTSVLPQQALALSNSELALHQGRVLAGKLWRAAEAESVPAQREAAFLGSAFEQILGRGPTAAERDASMAFLARQMALFQQQKAEIAAANQTAGTGRPSTDPAVRARENLVIALLNHSDFVTVR